MGLGIHSLFQVITRLPLFPGSSLLRWVGGLIGMPGLLTYRWPRPEVGAAQLAESERQSTEVDADPAQAQSRQQDGEAAVEASDEDEGEEDEDEEGDDDEEEEEEEEYDDEDEEDEEEEEEHPQGATESEEADRVAAAVAAAQAEAQMALNLPAELLEQVTSWEKQQVLKEGEWRQRQSRLHADFEERKRRLQEQQIGQRKKFRETCDEALRPLYSEGMQVCAELEKQLIGRVCRLCAAANDAMSLNNQQRGPLAKIKGVTFPRIDSPLRIPNCPTRGMASVPVSSGVLVTLEKIVDRNGIAMLPPSDDPMASFSRSGRGSAEIRLPLRLLGSRVHMLSEEEAAAALESATGTGAERMFIVRYSGGENGAPIEPVQILPEGLSLAEYDISFAAGVSALRVEHRLDGPVKCRAEPAARKEVFSDTPVELYTEEVDDETHNIVQLYFSDLRDEVAVDVVNLTNTTLTLQDTECCVFQQDATGAALNYKIIVRDGAVISVLYQEGEEVRPYRVPAVAHPPPRACPPPRPTPSPHPPSRPPSPSIPSAEPPQPQPLPP